MPQPDAPTLDTPVVSPEDEARLLDTFRHVAAQMPWYRTLLAERGVSTEQVRSAADFARLCPQLTKQNTFERFGVRALAATTPVNALASVLTSSGHGGRFSFGLGTRAMDAAGADAIDGALDDAFDVRSRPTLALNCLPMGVTFGSRCMTVATTSVREDMAAALVQAFGADFAQILLVADPLFLKRLVDHARHIGLDWRRHRVQVVVGEEVFGERFRAYMADRLGLDLADPHGTWLMSSMGVGELGLHLFYETRALVSLRRLAATTPALAQDLMGATGDVHGTPLCFTYDPRRIHVEVDAPGPDGFGPLLVSMLDPDLPIPLLRYQTGDIARLLDAGDVRAALRHHGAALVGDLPDRVVLVRGRAREVLPDGSHVAIYKDAIYADAAIADELTGAVRLTLDGTGLTMHVQRVPGGRGHAEMIDALRQALPTGARPTTIEIWPYERFPFGMTLDYERKFVSYVP